MNRSLPNMIPKVIHYCWFGGKPLPPLAKKCISSWQRVMPDYEIKRWDESNYNFKKNAFMMCAYEQKKWGFVPDFARIDIIYKYGGIYLDTDVEVIKSFNNLLKYPAFCGFESEHFVALGLGFGAEKGNEIIKQLMTPYEEKTKWENDDFIASPILQTQFLSENYNLRKDNTRQSLISMEVFPKSYFCPMDHITGKITITEDTFSIHHYMASWCTPASRKRGKIYKFLARYFGKKTADIVRKIWHKIKNNVGNFKQS